MLPRLALTAAAATLLLPPAVAAPARAAAVKLLLTEDAARVKLGADEIEIARLGDALAAAGSPETLLLLQGDGGALPARTLLPLADAAARAGARVRFVPSKTRLKVRFEPQPLDALDWAADAPALASVCPQGLPARHAAEGLDALLAIDLRGVVALAGTGLPLAVKTLPANLLSGAPPGEAGPGATLGVALADPATVASAFFLAKHAEEVGFHRFLLLMKKEGTTAGSGGVAGLLASLTEAGDAGGPLPRRAEPPTGGAPVYRTMRVLVEEALLAMRQALRPGGSLAGDDAFTDAEATALGLMLFHAAGVRAGDGTKAGTAVLAMERWLLAWPPDPRKHYPRRERAIVSAAMLEGYRHTRHPLLLPRAREALDEIAHELSTDEEVRDGLVKGFEAIGLAAARAAGLDGHEEPSRKLIDMVKLLVADDGTIPESASNRTSVDFLSLGLAIALLGNDPAPSRIESMIAQASSELPATDSNVANEKRAFGAFFHGRVATTIEGAAWDAFNALLQESLPRTQPRADWDFEEPRDGEIVCPWSGGGRIRSPARVALMAMTYVTPDQMR